MRQHRIVAVTQVHNEIRKGNLERFLRYLKPQVDALIAYDDASTDGSYEMLLGHADAVIRGTQNDFKNEREHKRLLVEKALEFKPDFILLIDADEVLVDQNGENLNRLADWVIENNLDGALIHDINLWRSHTWKRVDNDFDDAYFNRFWRVQGPLSYSPKEGGLHRSPAPDEIRRVERTDILSFLHFGFATEDSIADKYVNYAKIGQRGPDLSRIIDETELKLKRVDDTLYPKGLWRENEAEPKPLTPINWQRIVAKRAEARRPAISIVCLIYQSTTWLQFVYDQVRRHTDLSDKEFFFVANDATPEVKEFLHEHYIPHYIFENNPEQRQEWYINNVYRAWNYGAKMAKGDFIIFVNSDMAFSPGWVERLFEKYDGKNCISSRLVESGNLETGGLCIEKDFGRHVSAYDETGFLNFAKDISEPITKPGGAFMPLLIRKEHFMGVDGYPEGNVAMGSDPFNPTIAKKGEPLISGDVVLMDKLKAKYKVEHVTAFDSISYHFQEGEMRDLVDGSKAASPKEIAIINNSLHGRMNEKVMWEFLLERLPGTIGIDQTIVGAKEADFTEKANEYLKDGVPDLSLIIQNASFIDAINPSVYTLSYLQDDLRRMGRLSLEQEETLALSTGHVTNSLITASSYPEYFFDIIPIGVDEKLFSPGEKVAIRSKHNLPADKVIGIFVGDLSEVKGWSEIEKMIRDRSDIHWIIVSKDTERYEAENVSMYNQIDQGLLSDLYRAANFFILGSKVETQCLAAIEACLCDIPVIMRPVGIFAGMSEEERNQCGIFTDDLAAALKEISSRSFSPRALMLKKQLHVDGMIERWWRLIADIKLRHDLSNRRFVPRTSATLNFRRRLKMMFFNKTYLVLLAKRNLPSPIYRLLLSVWRKAKSLKRSMTK